MLVPVLGFVVLWVLAFSKWPNDKDGKTSTSVPGIILGIVLVPLSIGSVMMLSSAGMRVAVPAGQAAAAPQAEGPWQKYQAPPVSSNNPFSDPNYGKGAATPSPSEPRNDEENPFAKFHR